MDFSFTINEKEYEIPEVINLNLFEKAMIWDITHAQNLKPFVSIITECPLPALNELDDEVFNIILGACFTKINVEEQEPLKRIGLYELRPFEHYTFGDFMDVDLMLASGGIQKNAIELVCKMYSMPYEVACNMDINKVYGALLGVAKWREIVYRDYDEFFGLSESQDEPSTESIDASRLQLMWYEAVIVLADNNFLNISKVVERPYKEALNFLTYKKHQVDKQRLEQLKRKNELQRRT